MTQPNFKLDWSRVQRAAAAKKDLLDKSALANGLPTPELVSSINRFNSILDKLTQHERYALNQIA